MTDLNKLIGCLIKVTADGRRTRHGVLLPPAPRGHTLRLTVDGRAPIRFDPGAWTITRIAGPVYGFGELPAEHLATQTMLTTEKRMQPAPGQNAIATYKVRKGTVPLYAVADAAPMTALSPARAQAWNDARTCRRCLKFSARPWTEYGDAGRLCTGCQLVIADERWTAQARVAQAEAAKWARGVLADPDVLLIARTREFAKPRIRIETLGADGAATVVFDGRVRQIDDPGSIQFSPTWTPEKAQAWIDTYADTTSPSEFRQLADTLHEARTIAWHPGDRSIHIAHDLPLVQFGDSVDTRLALWSGESPMRTGWWYPEPRIGWSYYPQRCAPYTAHSQLRGNDNPEAEIASLRTLLLLMANSPAPEPTLSTIRLANR